MDTHKILDYLPIGVLSVLILVSLYILQEFVTVFFFGLLLTYLVYPIHRKLNNYFTNRVSTIFSCVLVLTVFVALASLAAFALLPQLRSLLGLFQGRDIENLCISTNTLCEKFFGLPVMESGKEFIVRGVEYFVETMFTNLVSILTSLPLLIVKLVLLLIVLYFGLLEGKRFYHYIRSLVTLRPKEIDAMQKRVEGLIFGVIYGAISVAILQGLLATLGYVIAGAPSPLFFGLLTILVAFIPFVGTAIIWVPLSVFLVTSAVDNWGLMRAVFLILYCLLIVSSIDNFIKPWIISKKAGVHPLLVFLGVLGGLHAFGAMGFLLGPVCLSLLIAMIEIIKAHYFHHSASRR